MGSCRLQQRSGTWALSVKGKSGAWEGERMVTGVDAVVTMLQQAPAPKALAPERGGDPELVRFVRWLDEQHTFLNGLSPEAVVAEYLDDARDYDDFDDEEE